MRIINRILRKNFFSNIWSFIFVIVITLVVVGFEALSPVSFKILIDNGLEPTSSSELPTWLAGFFTSRYEVAIFAVLVYFMSMLCSALFGYVQSITTKKVVRNVTASFSKEAFKNMESLAIGYYNKQDIGDYIYRLSYDTAALGNFLTEGVVPIITSSLQLIVTITIMFMISVKLSIITLIVLPFLTLCLYMFNSRIQRATKKSEISNSGMFSFIEEALTHIKVIQAFSEEKKESQIFDTKTDVSLAQEFDIFQLNFLLNLSIGVVIAISYSSIIFYGISSVFSDVLSVGLLLAFILYLDNVTSPLLTIIYSISSLTESYVRLDRLHPLFDGQRHVVEGGTYTNITDTAISFKHVVVKGDDKTAIIDDVSFDIEANKFTVIFGLNGSGKTTIMNLILRFIDKIDAGKITLGNRSIEEYDITALRNVLTYVPQEVSLFNDTIRHNIAFGNPVASEGDIIQAAKIAIAHDFVKKLPKGYDFQVGEGGTALSGGQRQRIMLARAFIKPNTKIFLLDETLSALDIKTRHEVIRSIQTHAKGKTIIAVSNIFDVVKVADNVIIMNKGKLMYSGPAHKIVHESSLYKMMLDN